MMVRAVDVMAPPLCVAPDLEVEALGRLLVRERADGACVTQGGRLVGVVTGMDLVFRHKRLHPPAFLPLLDAVVPLERPGRFRREVDKVLGMKVDDVMTRQVVTAAPDMLLEDVASMMVERHLTVVPVLRDDTLVGAITRFGLVQRWYGSDPAPSPPPGHAS